MILKTFCTFTTDTKVMCTYLNKNGEFKSQIKANQQKKLTSIIQLKTFFFLIHLQVKSIRKNKFKVNKTINLIEFRKNLIFIK